MTEGLGVGSSSIRVQRKNVISRAVLLLGFSRAANAQFKDDSALRMTPQ